MKEKSIHDEENLKYTEDEAIAELKAVLFTSVTPKFGNYVFGTVVKDMGCNPAYDENHPRYDEFWNRSTQKIRQVLVKLAQKSGPWDGIIENVYIPNVNPNRIKNTTSSD